MSSTDTDIHPSASAHRPPRICAAILAAGASVRFNGIKALAPVGSTTMLGHVKAQTDQLASVATLAIIGAHWRHLLPELTTLRLPFVCNGDWRSGQRSSVIAAARCVAQDVDALLVLTVDQIGVKTESLQQLIDAYARHPDHIVCATYARTRGVPAIFPRAMLPALTGLSADSGAKHLLYDAPNIVTIDLPAAALDIDRCDELAEFNRAHATHSARN